MHKGLDKSIIPSCQAKQEGRGSGTVRYFAYGANMASSTLAKRDIKPLSACPAQLPSHHSIAFRHRGGYATIMDTSAASGSFMPWRSLWQTTPVVKDSRASSAAPTDQSLQLVYHGPHGVLYELHKADLKKLTSRETGYAVSSATVTSYAGVGTSALLFTSQALLLLPASVPPQRRYLKLLLEGAKTHGLAPEYMQWLRELPCARPGGLGAEYFDTPSELLARCAAVGLAACAAFYAAMH